MLVQFKLGTPIYGAGWSGFRFSVEERDASLKVHSGFGAHPVSYLMGTGVLFPGEERPEYEVNHRPPSSGAISLFPLYTFNAWTGGNLPFTFLPLEFKVRFILYHHAPR